MNNKKYQENLKKAMTMLGKDKKTIFLGQTIVYGGSPMFGSCADVPKEKKIEMPVFEDTQLGLSIGLALEGFIPVTIFPRMDFLICATNQLVNHLDKVREMSVGEFKPGVIVRTQIGNSTPLYPGCQHCGDYTEGLEKMCRNTLVLKIQSEKKVIPYYKIALSRAKLGWSTILVEVPTGAYGDKK